MCICIVDFEHYKRCDVICTSRASRGHTAITRSTTAAAAVRGGFHVLLVIRQYVTDGGTVYNNNIM